MLRVVIFREDTFEEIETHETHESILDEIVETRQHGDVLITGPWRALVVKTANQREEFQRNIIQYLPTLVFTRIISFISRSAERRQL